MLESLRAASGGRGEAGRFQGALSWLLLSVTAPSRVFREVTARPALAVVLVALAVMVTLADAGVLSRLDLEALLRQQMGGEGGASEFQIQAELKKVSALAVVAPGISGIQFVVIVLGIAGFFYLAIRPLGGRANYLTVLSATAHAFWPATLVRCSLLFALAMARDELQIAEAKNLVPANLGAWLATDMLPPIRAAATSLDLLSLWTILLLILGLSTVSRLKKWRVAALVVSSWLLFVLAKVTVVAILFLNESASCLACGTAG